MKSCIKGDAVIKRLPVFIFILVAVGSLAGCAARVPEEITSRVTYRGDFNTLQQSPDRHEGAYTLFGGRIIGVENRENFSEMAVLQLPTDDDYRPQTEESSEGRFLVRTDKFLDPAVFEKGQLVTVAGKVTGSDSRMIGNYRYRYPIINAERIWTWEESRRGGYPIRFGIGVGTTF